MNLETNAKFENSQSLIFESTINTINYSSPELINKILDNQQQMSKAHGNAKQADRNPAEKINAAKDHL